MKHVRKSVLLWYSPQEMYELVTDVAAYPQFLPWCERSELLSQHAAGVTAKLSLSYMGVRQAFTTRNTHQAPDQVTVELVDGPFSTLEGLWLFKPLGNARADQRACKVELDLRYAFAGKALELVISPVFDKVANTLVDSFVRRAEQVYGPR